MFSLAKPDQSAAGSPGPLSPDLSLLPAALESLASAFVALAAALRAPGQPLPPGPALSPAPAVAPEMTMRDPRARTDAAGLAAGVTLLELANEFLLSRARLNRSDRYLRQLRVSIRSFIAGRARAAAAGIALYDVEAWLAAGKWKPATRRTYGRDVQTLFNWAVRRGLLARSPAAGLEVPRATESGPPGIHSPDQAAAVLAAALKVGPACARLLAIRYFAGLRTAEAERLEEADIRPGVIVVEAAKAKTRRRRVVEVRPNLAAWLALEGGRLPLPGAKYYVQAAARGAGVPWPPNVTRHSFVSYHLAAFGNAGKTALEAGHSEQVLFAHYRELVTASAAERFWAIMPPEGVG